MKVSKILGTQYSSTAQDCLINLTHTCLWTVGGSQREPMQGHSADHCAEMWPITILYRDTCCNLANQLSSSRKSFRWFVNVAKCQWNVAIFKKNSEQIDHGCLWDQPQYKISRLSTPTCLAVFLLCAGEWLTCLPFAPLVYPAVWSNSWTVVWRFLRGGHGCMWVLCVEDI